MFKRILIAYDGSDSAKAALAISIALAKSLGVDLFSISVKEHLPRYAASIEEIKGAKEQIDEHFLALTKDARDVATVEGVDLETLVRQGHEVEEILRTAREGSFDLLVLGSHGHSRVFERVIGSTSLSVARLTPCSVLIVRAGPGHATGLEQLKRILVGLDGSPLGRLAFRTALDLATLCGATLIGATVQERSPLSASKGAPTSYARQLQSAAHEHAQSAGALFEHVSLVGHAAQALRNHARDASVDLIVLGATGLEHPWSVTLGGTASGVANEAPCAVLLVRPPQAVRHLHEVMVRAVSAVAIDAPLADVVELLLRRNVKAVPVLDTSRHVVGIITGGDLLARSDLELRLSVKQELDATVLRERIQALRRSSKTARDVMTRHLRTIDGDADIATAIRLMAAHNVKRLPVVNRAKELIGIVSRADLLRAIAALPEPPSHVEPPHHAAARTVAEAATLDVPVVAADTPAEDVLERVLDSDLRRVVVTDAEQRVIGLVSDRDILARVSPDVRPWLVRLLRGHRSDPTARHFEEAGRPLTAADVMAPSLFTVRPDHSIGHAIRLMMQHRVKRLIIVDDQHRFQGLVDRREILRLLAGESI